ncbi:hypothetical protein Mal4_36280 [Maioricimonas rarisocia]|uniref:Uncharacterized protein n=1 Tax=Maioricimonas rarisocia TaxID=2528026 RepID=A0A517ZA58_9PLAN|nr:hypothetical protein Mal4_36280 [Maioricimonas rarisocia]
MSNALSARWGRHSCLPVANPPAGCAGFGWRARGADREAGLSIAPACSPAFGVRAWHPPNVRRTTFALAEQAGTGNRFVAHGAVGCRRRRRRTGTRRTRVECAIGQVGQTFLSARCQPTGRLRRLRLASNQGYPLRHSFFAFRAFRTTPEATSNADDLIPALTYRARLCRCRHFLKAHPSRLISGGVATRRPPATRRRTRVECAIGQVGQTFLSARSQPTGRPRRLRLASNQGYPLRHSFLTFRAFRTTPEATSNADDLIPALTYRARLCRCRHFLKAHPSSLMRWGRRCATTTSHPPHRTQPVGFLTSHLSPLTSHLSPLTPHASPHRVTDSHQPNSFLTSGVSRVRLYRSPVFRIASACVGYGWIVEPTCLSPRPCVIAIVSSPIMSPA